MIRFDRAVCDLIAFASAERSRYSLNGLHLRPDRAGVDASDGKILARLGTLNGDGVDMPATTDPETPVIIDRKGVAQLGKTLKGKYDNQNTASLDLANGNLAAVNANGSIPLPLVPGLYPAVDQVWPTGRAETRITLSADLLKRLATFVEKHGDGERAIDLYFGTARNGDGVDPDACVRFAAKIDDGRELTGILMPMDSGDKAKSRKARRR